MIFRVQVWASTPPKRFTLLAKNWAGQHAFGVFHKRERKNPNECFGQTQHSGDLYAPLPMAGYRAIQRGGNMPSMHLKESDLRDSISVHTFIMINRKWDIQSYKKRVVENNKCKYEVSRSPLTLESKSGMIAWGHGTACDLLMIQKWSYWYLSLALEDKMKQGKG